MRSARESGIADLPCAQRHTVLALTPSCRPSHSWERPLTARRRSSSTASIPRTVEETLPRVKRAVRLLHPQTLVSLHDDLKCLVAWQQAAVLPQLHARAA